MRLNDERNGRTIWFIQQEGWDKWLWARMQQLRRRRQVSLDTSAAPQSLGAGIFALVAIQSSGSGIACLIRMIPRVHFHGGADHTSRFWHHPPAIMVWEVVGQHLFLNIILSNFTVGTGRKVRCGQSMSWSGNTMLLSSTIHNTIFLWKEDSQQTF